MKKLLLIIFFIGLYSTAQKASNITTRQELSTIIVSYDLEAELPCKVSLYVSTNGGTTWQGPLNKVSGDVGNKITSGSHNITWNVLEEFEELKGENIKFQVKAAIIDDIETVIIGTQEWMKYNIDTRYYNNGDLIYEVKDSDKWSKLKKGAWCFYDNKPVNGYHYGKLYNWYAINDPRGIAPKGFHIASDEEWKTLIDFLGGENVAGSKMKSIGTRFWVEPNSDANNISGFEALPGGCRDNLGDFQVIGYKGIWWSLSNFDKNNIFDRELYWSIGNIFRNNSNKQLGLSVRCIRD
ncbi:fibrobacter succinogenes major paralogous domain-containing protein [Flavobacterium sp.]|uniref:fibrobacter succinogenes major paralogous domain-containing protein n=1 Tax=Flavobacterium sp. TaxID=239 RepID=UPI0037BE5AEA